MFVSVVMNCRQTGRQSVFDLTLLIDYLRSWRIYLLVAVHDNMLFFFNTSHRNAMKVTTKIPKLWFPKFISLLFDAWTNNCLQHRDERVESGFESFRPCWFFAKNCNKGSLSIWSFLKIKNNSIFRFDRSEIAGQYFCCKYVVNVNLTIWKKENYSPNVFFRIFLSIFATKH